MFESVTLEFGDKQYKVEPERVWGLIAAIEQHCSFLKLGRMWVAENMQRTVLIEALTAGLNYAGANVKRDDVNVAYTAADLYGIAATLIEILKLAEPPENTQLPADKPSSKQSRKTGK